MNALSRSALALLAARSGGASAFSPPAVCRPTAAARNSRPLSSTTTALSATGTQYCLHYDYVPDVLEKRGPHRAEHLDLAQKFISEGKCLAGGPTGPPNMEVPTGAMFVFTDAEAAAAMRDNDPYVEHGIVTDSRIVEWNVVVAKE
mmetsp:Transcript_23929/g.56272  ORF Transcript_23929/g.56272 Transcript_23929/m.56272 type:complete len:146 (-) Transcript_23929:231-668(-)